MPPSASLLWLSSADRPPHIKGRQALEAMGADPTEYFQAAPLTSFSHTPSFTLARPALTLSMAASSNTTVGELHPAWVPDCSKLTGPSLQGSPVTGWAQLGAGELC